MNPHRPAPPSPPIAHPPLANGVDRWVFAVDQALRTLAQAHQARRPLPRPESRNVSDGAGATPQEGGPATPPPSAADAALSASLMRVNHVGEVCAQALYSAQALATRDPALRAHFDAAADEEVDHLVWTEQRLRALGSRTSILNPLWYAGAFGIGLFAARLGDAASLGFVIETERQVEEHLANHLERLPAADAASRAIVAVMRDDEVRHADEAAAAGGLRPPQPVQWLMRAAAKVMTTTAHHV